MSRAEDVVHDSHGSTSTSTQFTQVWEPAMDHFKKHWPWLVDKLIGMGTSACSSGLVPHDPCHKVCLGMAVPGQTSSTWHDAGFKACVPLCHFMRTIPETIWGGETEASMGTPPHSCDHESWDVKGPILGEAAHACDCTLRALLM